MTGSEIRPGERVKNVHLSEDIFSVDLLDGRTITVPYAWYPSLLHASPEQRANWQISASGYGIHWPDIDEDLSTEGLLRGTPAPRSRHVSPPWLKGHAMRRDELVDALRSSPFRPFRLYVSDGGIYEIRHPEMLMVGRHAAVVGMRANGDSEEQAEKYPVIDRFTTVDLLHVTRIKQLASPERR